MEQEKEVRSFVTFSRPKTIFNGIVQPILKHFDGTFVASLRVSGFFGSTNLTPNVSLQQSVSAFSSVNIKSNNSWFLQFHFAGLTILKTFYLNFTQCPCFFIDMIHFVLIMQSIFQIAPQLRRFDFYRSVTEPTKTTFCFA